MSTSFSDPFAFECCPPLDPGLLACDALEWDALEPPSFPVVVFAAREFAILYAETSLVFPQLDRDPPRLWVIRSRDGPPRQSSSLRSIEERIKFHKLRLVQTLSDVDPEILQYALQFSIEARMAPMWNRVERYLLQGRLFIRHSTSYALQPRLQLTASDFTVGLVVRAGQLRLPNLTLDDFDLEHLIRQRFDQNIVDTIPQQYIGQTKVLVLPNLTQATVTSITKKMLTSERLRTWKDMKRYWKNMYGFRLSDDDTEEPEFFCNVTFGSGSGNFSRAIFSYPQWCVRGMEPFAMPRTDPAPIVEKFMKDLSAKIPTVCGQALVFPYKDVNQVPTSQIAPAATCSSKQGLLNASVIPSIAVNDSSQKRIVTPSTCPGHLPSSDFHDHVVAVHGGAKPDSSGDSSQKGIEYKLQSGVPELEVPPRQTPAPMIPRFLPVMKMPPRRSFISSSPRIRPPSSGPLVPTFTPTRSSALRFSPSAASNPGTPRRGSLLERLMTNPSPAGSVPLPVTVASSVSIASPPVPPTPRMSSMVHGTPARKRPNKSPGGSDCGVSATPIYAPLDATSAALQTKRKKTPDATAELSDEDMMSALRGNELKKVNVPTLMQWLRNRGLTCKKSSRKEELICQVKEMLEANKMCGEKSL